MGSPPYVTPYLDALDRLQERTIVRPDQLTDRSRKVLDEHFGTRPDVAEAAFAHGIASLIGEHTHYFDGFAVLMPLPLGTAVAARISQEGSCRIIFEGGDEAWTFGADPSADADKPEWVRLSEEIFRRLLPDAACVEVAVVSTIPSACFDGYMAALGIATARVAQSLFALAQTSQEVQRLVCDVIEACTGYPFSIAYPIAADEALPQEFALIDTHTLEHLSLEAPSRDIVGWGLVDVGMGVLQRESFHTKMRDRAKSAADTLRRKGFPGLGSLRDLEHKDLKVALDLLPRKHRPVVRHLVTENRRVQKLVAAIQRRDWQMFGALLLMSHSSHQKDWGSTNELVDVVVHETETMSIEGMYGAGITGRGGCVLVAGQPFIVPRCLDRIQVALKERFDIRPDVTLL